jgi:hypothetical protein
MFNLQFTLEDGSIISSKNTIKTHNENYYKGFSSTFALNLALRAI